MNGATSNLPTGASPSAPLNRPPGSVPRPRRKALANPLVANRRPVKSKPQPPAAGAQKSAPQQLAKPAPGIPIKPALNPAARTEAFTRRPPSPTPEGELQTFPVFTTKRELLEGLRHHIARLQSKDIVDVTDESVFTRPVRLHRKDPSSRPVGSEPTTPDPEVTAKDEIEEKERERIDAIKQEAKRIREENQKQIAPSAAVLKKKQMFSKNKTQQVYRPNDTVEEQKKSQLKYEEAFPWHIEDDDNKHTWMGAFESTLSDCHLLFVMDDNKFRVVPVEKFYRFKEKGRTKQLDTEVVNELMNKKSKEPRFIMLKKLEMEKKSKQNELASHRRFAKKGGEKFAGTGARVKKAEENDGESLFQNPDIQEGADEVDFDNDELFDDDEENPLFEGQEEIDTKAQLEKIKKEQLEANAFDLNDENEVEAEEEQKEKQVEFQKKADKKIRKALLKREKNFNYEDDSDDENPYSSGSEEDDSSQAEGADQKSPEKSKPGQPGSVKGDTTPSDRKKGADAKTSLKRTAEVEMSEASGNESTRVKKKKLNPSNQTLKRPGSPDASGASGNESSRKKQKLGAGLKVAQNRQVSALRGNAGSGSDSDSSKRLKGSRSTSSQPTPGGSRAQSPVGRSAAGSRSASPAPSDIALPTAEEIVAAIPARPEGILLKQLVTQFKARLTANGGAAAFTKLVRSIAHYDKTSQKVFRAA